MKTNKLHPDIQDLLQTGTVIPAHPLALTEGLTIDENRQRLLTRYYIASGVGGVAVGVHTTQFEIRKPEFNMLERVLELAADEVSKAQIDRPFIKVAGVVGPTSQAVREAELAVKYGYDLGLVSMAGLTDLSEKEVIEHIRTIANIIPVFGFYLQTTIGGRAFSYDFWKEFMEIPNVQAVKVAAFNRYQTLDVVRALCFSSRAHDVALYTGNDDNIVADLLTPYRFEVNGQTVEKRFVGGLLGHWATWTQKAVELFGEIKACVENNYEGIDSLLQRNIEVTDMNAATFDPSHKFHGCIPGIHEVLRRQGILKGLWTLNSEEKLSEGQLEEIDRVIKAYPHLVDDAFVQEWLAGEQSLVS
ncbi:dihydrodipicolinate synthase family protein [Telluribacter humicola]|uniref:dihydrodipicolinate synthase family protein n=1 Tax=Telluribacter humicola TaxID=1720261 RepID=UPI001A96190B|nr:dihydrodipicolinate synthase family protein [Telluribacter humicola]